MVVSDMAATVRVAAPRGLRRDPAIFGRWPERGHARPASAYSSPAREAYATAAARDGQAQLRAHVRHVAVHGVRAQRRAARRSPRRRGPARRAAGPRARAAVSSPSTRGPSAPRCRRARVGARDVARAPSGANVCARRGRLGRRLLGAAEGGQRARQQRAAPARRRTARPRRRSVARVLGAQRARSSVAPRGSASSPTRRARAVRNGVPIRSARRPRPRARRPRRRRGRRARAAPAEQLERRQAVERQVVPEAAQHAVGRVARRGGVAAVERELAEADDRGRSARPPARRARAPPRGGPGAPAAPRDATKPEPATPGRDAVRSSTAPVSSDSAAGQSPLGGEDLPVGGPADAEDLPPAPAVGDLAHRLAPLDARGKSPTPWQAATR